MKPPLLILCLLGALAPCGGVAEIAPSPETSPAAASTHWAFQPIRNPTPPAVQNPAWCRSDLDRFLLADWERAGVTPAPEADRRTWLRRVTFDLTGLPPSIEETDAFLADATPEAWERVVDRLLASPHYGEHWGRHWLDVVRYADTAGETADYPVPVAWRYRNYVIQAFNTDKPYDAFLREQIAGDILAREGPRERYAERVTATGYLALSRRFGFDSENYHHLTLQDTLDTLGQSVLGLTLGCARCHAHKYDPVSMPDYYALYGIFESTRYAFPGSEQKQRHRALVPLVPPDEAAARWRAFEVRVASLIRQLEAQKQSPPNAILRSLDDLDGDFEMQAPAAGGSKGVLVPPWVYQGPIAVTPDAQSPFKNLHPLGKVGASVPAGTDAYSIAQALYPRRDRAHGGTVEVNLDFRLSPAAAGVPPGGPDQATLPAVTRTRPHHRFRLGTQSWSAFEVGFSLEGLWLQAGDRSQWVRPLEPGTWYNLQLSVDLKAGTVTGRVGKPGDVTAFPAFAWASGPDDALDHLELASANTDRGPLPAVAFDNLGVQDTPIPPVSTEPSMAVTAAGDRDPAEVRKELEALLASGPFDMAYAVSEGTPRDARLQIRGEPDRPGDVVPRGLLPALGGGPLPTSTRGSGRLALAEWVTDPRNPLTARVMVNRIWQYHFGQGLVRTPNDFGTRGQPPSHPDLLDYLATCFVRDGWSIKAMHSRILASAAYRQQSAAASAALECASPLALSPRTLDADATTPLPLPRRSGQATLAAGSSQGSLPGGETLAAIDRSPDAFTPFPRRRLAAEEIRDAMLRTSGGLDPTPGEGHPFPAPTSWGYTQHGPYAGVYDHSRRSVYLMTQRIKRHPFLALFDGPDPNASTPERRTSTVPTQALYFLNDPLVHAQAERVADRMLGAGPDPVARVGLAYRRILGRNPTPIERDEGVAFLDAYRKALPTDDPTSERTVASAFARVLFGSNEFLTID